MHLTSRLLLGAALLLPVSARAQGVSAETAQSLQSEFQGWLAGMLGPAANPAALTPHVVAQDDHYELTLAIPGLVGDNNLSAQLKPLTGGRWDLSSIHLPPSIHFNAHMPESGGEPDGMTAFAITLGSQRAHATIDPALNSPCSLEVALRDVAVRSEGPRQRQQQHMGVYHVTATLQPTQAGKLDFSETAEISDWSSLTEIQGQPPISFGARHMQGRGQITGLDRNQAGILLSAVSGVIATLPPRTGVKAPHPPLTPAQRNAWHQLVEGLRGIFTSLQGEETIQDLHVTLPGKGDATVQTVHLGLGGDAPNGLMHLWLDVSLHGLSVPGLPPETAGLVPHQVTLRPSVSGVPASGVMDLALHATQPNPDQAALQAEAMALLTTPGASVALDTIGFNLGPAVVQGNGHLTSTGPGEYQGEAHLTATGLDALMRQAQSDPQLQRAIPVLAMLRGFARPEGDHLAWDVKAHNGLVTVNDIPVVQPHPREPQGSDQPLKQ